MLCHDFLFPVDSDGHVWKLVFDQNWTLLVIRFNYSAINCANLAWNVHDSFQSKIDLPIDRKTALILLTHFKPFLLFFTNIAASYVKLWSDDETIILAICSIWINQLLADFHLVNDDLVMLWII